MWMIFVLFRHAWTWFCRFWIWPNFSQKQVMTMKLTCIAPQWLKEVDGVSDDCDVGASWQQGWCYLADNLHDHWELINIFIVLVMIINVRILFSIPYDMYIQIIWICKLHHYHQFHISKPVLCSKWYGEQRYDKANQLHPILSQTAWTVGTACTWSWWWGRWQGWLWRLWSRCQDLPT